MGALDALLVDGAEAIGRRVIGEGEVVVADVEAAVALEGEVGVADAVGAGHRDRVATHGHAGAAQEEGESGQESGTTGQHRCNVSGMTLRRGRRPVTLGSARWKGPGSAPEAHVRGGVS